MEQNNNFGIEEEVLGRICAGKNLWESGVALNKKLQYNKSGKRPRESAKGRGDEEEEDGAEGKSKRWTSGMGEVLFVHDEDDSLLRCSAP